MCGIVGLVATPWQADAEPMLGALRARGPDAQKLAIEGEATLGTARLRVIDLAGGEQPMRSADGRYLIAYNGEIYNFRELRAQLEALGHVFRTRSDTEVLLHGYAAWGEKMPARLDGMFAFAIWDARERELFAARDRVGVKPFFYSTPEVTRGGLAFASTLAPFFKLRGFPAKLDYEALRDYLAFQVCLAPHSFLADVRQLPPASFLRWRRGRFDVSRYWDLPQRTSNKDSREEV